MTCPACSQSATSLMRNVFTLQGVTFSKSMIGFLKCQHCGTLLRVTNYGKFFWYFYIPIVVGLMILVIVHRSIKILTGTNPGVVWVAFVVMIFVTFVFAVWRHAQVEQVDSAKPPGVG